MLDKLLKYSLFFSFTFLGGCYIPTPKVLVPTPKYDTELNCPRENYRIVLLETTPSDVRKAINNAIEQRNEFKTTENYTVLKLPNKKTFFVQNITPERMQFCYLIEIPAGTPPPSAIPVEIKQ